MKATELMNLLCEGLDIDADCLQPETIIKEVEEWNSLGWLSIMALVDERLSVQINSKDIRSFHTVQDVINYISAKAELVK